MFDDMQKMTAEISSEDEISGPRTGPVIVIRLFLLLGILMVFGRTLFTPFVLWDDNKLIYNNPSVNPGVNPNAKHDRLSDVARSWDPRDPNDTKMYDPLVFTMWWVLARLPVPKAPDPLLDTSLNPMPFHAANLIVHWLTVCIVFEILRRLKIPDWPAAAGAALFAFHPLQVEAIAWATGMKDLLSGFFAMTAIWRYMTAVESQDRRRCINYIVASILYVLALLAKPSSAAVPLIVFALDACWYRRSFRTAVSWTAPWFIMAGMIGVLAKSIQSTSDVVSNPLWSRPLIAGDALMFYLSKLAVPAWLSFDYARSPEALFKNPALHHTLYWAWIIPVVIGVVIFLAGKPKLTLGALIFFLGVVPVLGFVPFQFQYHSTVADRYVYLSMLGAAIVAAAFLAKLPELPAAAMGLVGLIGLSILAFVQAGMWNDTETLYVNGINRGWPSPMHYFVLGTYRDKVSEMYAQEAEKISTEGDISRASGQFGNAVEQRGMAIDAYEIANTLDPTFAEVYRHLIPDLIRANRIQDAIVFTQRRIAVQPDLPSQVRDNPAELHGTLGFLYYRQERWALAIQEFEETLKYAPSPQIAQLLKQARENLGDTTEPSTEPATNP